MTRLLLATGFVLSLARVASAEVCVGLDESRDTLPPEDRRAAMISFQQALTKNGVQVGEGNCTATYTIYNVKLGNTITVYVNGPAGTVQGRATKLDELPLVYEQLAKSIITGQPMSDQTTDRTNATTDQMAPRRVGADNLKFLSLGYGVVTGAGAASGPSFGYGLRFELDRLAVEISGDLVFASSNDAMGNGHGGISGNSIKLAGYYYQNPLANASLYYGLGLGYGIVLLCGNDVSSCYSGGGLDLSPTVGYEMLRSSTIRLLVQVAGDLPLFTAEGTLSGGATDRKWIPTIHLTVGIGWGKSNTIRVINQNQ